MRRHLVWLALASAPTIACSIDPDGVSFDSAGSAGSATKADAVGDTDRADPDQHDTGDDTSGGSSDEHAECGNGIREGDEQCDGQDFDDQTCQDFGFSHGSLSCSSACAVQTGGCYSCGDGVKEDGEVCDGDDHDGTTCASLGHASGTLSCAPDCQSFDTTGCDADQCGNGIIDPGEQCDGNDFGGHTCDSQGFGGGQLGCTASCTFDTSGCSNDAGCGWGGEFCNSGADCCTGLCVFGLCA